MELQQKQLKEFALTDELLDTESTVSAIQDIQLSVANAQESCESNYFDTTHRINLVSNKLSGISFNPDNYTNFEYMADTIRDIIKAFGGTIENDGVTQITMHVSQDDIDAGKGTIVFTTMPIVAGNDQSSPKITACKNLE